jgi:septin family protein
MKRLGTRVNLIPVIAKADTLTQSDLFTFKQRVSFFLYLTLPYMQSKVFTWYL